MKIVKRFIFILNMIFGLLSLLLLLLLIYICVDAAICQGYRLDISQIGIDAFQDFWRQYSFLLKGFAGCATIFIAGYNLSQYINVALVESLAQLRARLDDEPKKRLHLDLMGYGDSDLARDVMRESAIKSHKSSTPRTDVQYTSADVLDYLGTIELGAIMLRKGVISIEEFNQQFGYRVVNLLASEQILEHIKNNEESYKDLRYVVKELLKHDMLEDEAEFE